MPSSSSDSDDNAEQRRLAEALDPDFLGVGKHKLMTNGSNLAEMNNVPPSKRPKHFAESTCTSEFEYDKPYSLEVTPECQKFIAKQLAKSVDKRIKEVSTPMSGKSLGEEKLRSGIKLFSSSACLLTENDLKEETGVRQKRQTARQRKNGRKRGGKSDSSSDSDSEKLKSVAVSADWVLNSTS